MKLFDKENIYFVKIDDSNVLETILNCELILKNSRQNVFDFKILDHFIEESPAKFFPKIVTFIQKIFSIDVFEDERIYLLFNQSKIFIVIFLIFIIKII